MSPPVPADREGRIGAGQFRCSLNRPRRANILHVVDGSPGTGPQGDRAPPPPAARRRRRSWRTASGEVELAERFGVSRMTVRQAFNSLVADGLVVRYRSKGTFASVRVLEDVSTLTSEDFLSRWEAQGHQVSMRMRALGLRPAPDNVAERFAVPPQSTLYYVERLRLVDGLALAWDVRWLPAAFGEQVTARGAGDDLAVLAPRRQGLRGRRHELRDPCASGDGGGVARARLRSRRHRAPPRDHVRGTGWCGRHRRLHPPTRPSG